MPKVEQYGQNRFNTGVTSGARARPHDEGFSALGAGVGEFGRQMDQLHKRRSEVEAEDALVQFEREKNDLFFNPDSGYFNTQGRNAYDTAGSVNEALDKLKERYSSSINNETARLLFDNAADQHITRARVDIDRHASKGLDVWELATIKASTENALENATLYYNQPGKLAEFEAVGELQIQELTARQGVGAEAAAEELQNFRSSFAKNAVLAALNNSAAEAEKLMIRFDEKIEGPDKIKLETQIAARKKLEKERADSANAIQIATSLVASNDKYTDVLDGAYGIKDPELKKKTLSEINFLWNQKKTAEKERRADNYNDAHAFVLGGGSINEWMVGNLEAWADLTPNQKNDLMSGKDIQTSLVRYNELVSLPDNEFVALDLEKDVGKLSPSDYKKLVDRQRQIRTKSTPDDHQIGRTRSQQVTAALVSILGEKDKWTDEKRERADRFYGLLDSEVSFREQQQKRKLSSEEFTKALNDLSREVVIQRDWWPDKTTNVTDISPDDVRVLTEALRQRGIPVTAQTLMNAYRQANAPESR